MAQNIYRRDTRSNLLDLPPSRKEIVTIEDDSKFGLIRHGTLRTLAQLLEKNGGVEVRDWDTNFGKGVSGTNSFDVSTSIDKYGTGAIGSNSFVSGIDTTSSGDGSVASGSNSVASGNNSVASGSNSVASGDNSVASGNNSVASGEGTEASGNNSVASGNNSVASGNNSVASGNNSVASGNNSVASGNNSVVSGGNSVASGSNSVASGEETIASNNNETVVGQFNDISNIDTIFAVGCGVSGARKNAIEVNLDGTISAPELSITKIDSDRSLITREFIQTKITLSNWNNDFDISINPISLFSSDIEETDTHANISAVFIGGVLIRPSKYSLLNSGGFKSVQIHSNVTLNEGDWVSLQNTKVFVQG